jgi:hypothetical protein
MRRILSGWSVAVAVGCLMLLAPASALAVALTSAQHFILGRLPYLENSVDGTDVDPGTNAPMNPVGESTQDLSGPFSWIKLSGSDFTVTSDYTIPIPGFTMGTEADGSPIGIDWSITWKGTIGGAPWQEAILPMCDMYETANCDLMRVGEEIKIMFVQTDVRWTERNPADAWLAFQNGQSLWGGFDKDSIVGDIIAGPLHVDDSNSDFLVKVPGKVEYDNAMGIKYLATANQAFLFSETWLLAEDPTDYGSIAGNEFNVGWNAFVYLVPEPGTSLLLVSGLMGLAACGRRRSA